MPLATSGAASHAEPKPGWQPRGDASVPHCDQWRSRQLYGFGKGTLVRRPASTGEPETGLRAIAAASKASLNKASLTP